MLFGNKKTEPKAKKTNEELIEEGKKFIDATTDKRVIVDYIRNLESDNSVSCFVTQTLVEYMTEQRFPDQWYKIQKHRSEMQKLVKRDDLIRVLDLTVQKYNISVKLKLWDQANAYFECARDLAGVLGISFPHDTQTTTLPGRV